MEMDSHEMGTLPGSGSFRCSDCGYVLSLITRDRLPSCPACGGEEFARASLLVVAPEEPPAAVAEEPIPRLAALRARLDAPGDYLVFEDGEDVRILPLTGEWTRVGRSLVADLRFDDPTVSRRHALFVRAADGVRVLDDRSMNGVFVNGERVGWAALRDGDEIMVGRHSLRFLTAGDRSPGRSAVPAESGPAPR